MKTVLLMLLAFILTAPQPQASSNYDIMDDYLASDSQGDATPLSRKWCRQNCNRKGCRENRFQMQTCMKRCSVKYFSTKACIRGGFKDADAFCRGSFLRTSGGGQAPIMSMPRQVRTMLRDNCMYTAKLGERKQKRMDRWERFSRKLRKPSTRRQSAPAPMYGDYADDMRDSGMSRSRRPSLPEMPTDMEMGSFGDAAIF